MENENEFTYDDMDAATTSSSAVTVEEISILNLNMVSGFLYITGALGIISGILIGKAFHGIFRSR